MVWCYQQYLRRCDFHYHYHYHNDQNPRQLHSFQRVGTVIPGPYLPLLGILAPASLAPTLSPLRLLLSSATIFDYPNYHALPLCHSEMQGTHRATPSEAQ
jgi:hypothetical protein